MHAKLLGAGGLPGARVRALALGVRGVENDEAGLDKQTTQVDSVLVCCFVLISGGGNASFK